MPETFEVPEAFSDDDIEAVQCRIFRPDGAGKDVVVGRERDDDHIVNRRQRPNDQHDAQQHGGGFPRATGRAVAPWRKMPGAGDTHSCPSDMRSLRIRMKIRGINTGKAVITSATPRRGSDTV